MAVPGDLLLFGSLPDPVFAAAAALVVSGALLVARHEVRRAQRDRAAASGTDDET